MSISIKELERGFYKGITFSSAKAVEHEFYELELIKMEEEIRLFDTKYAGTLHEDYRRRVLMKYGSTKCILMRIFQEYLDSTWCCISDIEEVIHFLERDTRNFSTIYNADPLLSMKDAICARLSATRLMLSDAKRQLVRVLLETSESANAVDSLIRSFPKTKKIVIEVIDDDSDDEGDSVPDACYMVNCGGNSYAVTSYSSKREKRRAKKDRQRTRRAAALAAKRAENDLIDSYIECQSGYKKPSILQENISRFSAFNLTRDERNFLANCPGFCIKQLSNRAIKRLKRDIIQQRHAKMAVQRAAQGIPPNFRERDRQKSVKRDRRQKYDIETEGLPAVILHSLLGMSALIGAIGIHKVGKASENLAYDIAGIKTKLVEMFADLDKNLSRWVKPIVKNMLIAGVVYFLWRGITVPVLRILFTRIIGNLFKGEDKAVVLEVFKEESSKSKIESQSDVETLGMLPKLLATVLVVSMANKNLRKGTLLATLITAFSNIPRVTKGVEGFAQVLMDVIETAAGVLTKYLNLPEFKFRKQIDKEIDSLVKDVYEFESDNKKGKLKSTQLQQHTYLTTLLGRCTTLMYLHRENRDAARELKSLRGVIVNMLEPLRGCVGANTGFRPEPVSLLIESPPGIGKTSTIQNLIASILVKSEIVENISGDNLKHYVYTKAKNSAYYDGYMGQPAYYIDDIFARLPNSNSEVTEFDDVMAFVGCFTTMLNMAECEKKGMFPFTSKLLLMTTNMTDLTQVHASQCLLKPQAFARRIKTFVHMEVRPEYRKEGSFELDFVKFNKEKQKLLAAKKTGMDAFPWYVFEYWETTFGTHSYTSGTGKPLDRLVYDIAEKIKFNSVYHDINMKVLERQCMPEGVLEEPPEDVVVIEPPQKIYSESGFETVTSVDSADHQNHVEEPFYVGDDDTIDYDMSDLPPLGVGSSSEFCRGRRRHNEPSLKSGKFSFWNTPRWVKPYKVWSDFDIYDKVTAAIEVILAFTAFKVMIQPLICMFLNAVSGLASHAFGCKNKLTFSPAGLFYRAALAPRIRDEAEVEFESNGPKPRKMRFEIQQQAIRHVDPVWHKVYKNSYKIVVTLVDGSVAVLGQAIALRKTTFVLPNHFLLDMKRLVKSGALVSDSIVTMTNCGSVGKVIRMTYSTFLEAKTKIVPDRDLAFIRFPKGFEHHSDIIKFILKDSEINRIGGYRVRLDTAHTNEVGEMEPFNSRITYETPAVKVGQIPVRMGSEEQHVWHKRWFEYFADTGPGDCGAPLTVCEYNSLQCRFFCGLHVGRDKHTGLCYSTPLDQELCYQAVTELGDTEAVTAPLEKNHWPADVELHGLSEESLETFGNMGSFTPLFEVSPGVSSPVRSNLVFSSIGKAKELDEEISLLNDGKEPPELIPMKLGVYTDPNTGETVFPMQEAIKPFHGDIFVASTADFSRAVSVAMKPFSDSTLKYFSKVLDFDTAVRGDPVIGLKSICRKTSVGWPLCTQRIRDKSHFFGNSDEFDLTLAAALELKDVVLDMEKTLREGQSLTFICRDFLKDEFRKKGKNARLIAGTDVRLYILCRMYFGAFVAAVMRSHRSSGMCVGMNPYTEWAWLERFLLEKDPTGKNVWDGDFSGFDSSQMPTLLWTLLEYINEWYTLRAPDGYDCTADNAVREMLFADMVHSKHLVSLRGEAKTVVQWSKSLPSGHFLTSTVNSMLSMSLIVSGYIELVGDLDFWSEAAAATMGDDNLVAVSDKHKEVFNQVTLASFLDKKYRMVYTAGRKDEELQPFVGLDKVIFLQRRFARKDGRVVCPIRPESFLHSLYYTKKGDSQYVREVLLAGIENAFEELAMHDEKYWEPVSRKLARLKERFNEAPNHLISSGSGAYLSLVLNRVPDWV